MITPGKYITRDGRTAVVLCNDAPGQYPVIGYVIYRRPPHPDHASPEGWTARGLTTNSGHTSPRDLMELIPEPA